MEPTNLFIIVVFALGVSVGGLTVSLHRQCTIERIKREFEAQLDGLVRTAAVEERQIATRSVPRHADTVIEEPEPDEHSWDYLPAAHDYRPDIKHIPV